VSQLSPGENRPDRRARRRLQRSNEVYEAAIALFVERGYDATTMGDIADRADVARTSVFNYFPRKAAFLYEWIERRRRRAAIATQGLDDQPIAEILASYLGELAGINVAGRAEAAVLMPLTFHYVETGPTTVGPLGDTLAAYVKRAAERREIRAGVSPAIVGTLIANGYFATVLQWLCAQPPPFDLREELRQMLDIVLHGIAPDVR
jgi:AcrR family transcriptional regulator